MAHLRVSLSLPPAVADDLDHVASLLGVSRSSFAALVLEDALRTLTPAAEYYAASAPGKPSPLEEVFQGRRLRGSSGQTLRDAFRELRRVADSIDPDAFELTPPVDGGR